MRPPRRTPIALRVLAPPVRVALDALERELRRALVAALPAEQLVKLLADLGDRFVAPLTDVYLAALHEGRAGAPTAHAVAVVLAYLDAVSAACGVRVPPLPTACEVVESAAASRVMVDALSVAEICRSRGLPLSEESDP